MITWSVDTDVAVICPRIVKELNIQQLFFMAGTKCWNRFIPMQAILDNLEVDFSVAFPITCFDWLCSIWTL